MKRRLIFIFTLCAMLYVLCVPLAQAVPGTVTTSWTHYPQHEVSILTVSWVGGTVGEAGTVPATALPAFQGWVFQFITDPGATAPTTLYDITLPDADGLDVAGATLMDRSATVTGRAMPLLATSTYGPWWVDSVLTFTLTNNSVASSTGTLKIYIKRRDW
jgi:hypothetical protein